jgi:hypothetical protein
MKENQSNFHSLVTDVHLQDVMRIGILKNGNKC